MSDLIDIFIRLEIARADFWQAWITSISAKLWSTMLRRHRTRQAIEELAAFDDRMLQDIGICRHEIEYVVSHGSGRS